jgi:hypothetical protein
MKGKKAERPEKGAGLKDTTMHGEEGSFDIIKSKASNINRSNLLSQMKINIYCKSTKVS